MSYANKMQDDEYWQRGNKFSPIGYLKHLCFKAFYLALVGRPSTSAQAVPAAMLPAAPNDPPNRSALP
jgi:hypothetical protein